MKRILLALALMAMAGSAHAQKFQADSQINVTSLIITNSNTPVVISNKTATVYSIDGANNNGTVSYLKLYNAVSLAACGTGTPFARYLIPGSVSGANIETPNINGDAYVNGIVACVVTGIADSNTTAPAASSGVVNIHWKQGQQ